MRALLVLALASCNEYYGLAPTKLVDAQLKPSAMASNFRIAFMCPPGVAPLYGG